MTKTKKKTEAKRKATNAVSRKEILEKDLYGHVKILVPKYVSKEWLESLSPRRRDNRLDYRLETTIADLERRHEDLQNRYNSLVKVHTGLENELIAIKKRFQCNGIGNLKKRMDDVTTEDANVRDLVDDLLASFLPIKQAALELTEAWANPGGGVLPEKMVELSNLVQEHITDPVCHPIAVTTNLLGEVTRHRDELLSALDAMRVERNDALKRIEQLGLESMNAADEIGRLKTERDARHATALSMTDESHLLRQERDHARKQVDTFIKVNEELLQSANNLTAEKDILNKKLARIYAVLNPSVDE